MQTCSTSDAARGKGQDSLIDLNDPGTMRAVDGTYDVILLGDILEHLVDPGRVLLELKERLNEGAAFTFQFPILRTLFLA